MFTEFDYLKVLKVATYGIERNGVDRFYQLLFVEIPNSKKRLCFSINRQVDILHLKKGDRVRIKLDWFVKGFESTVPQFKVVAVIKID
ncbi:hypothetical protein [Enterococcus phoeniculicola]|uniref:Uncharacterized protein n=1 Tax=Enterococcus phoeniculicola ATCC BAA-412 TaxID=1158610 RepID=R3TXF8_9ENTE|nr:hypothetical protein [Enterococcus phoeniculicola]EOL46304.1 hypothetical protein UC3_01110 [Enterococcus phoeniculicola ATCC BAA-412]EOT76851.1 hypothetical protein I589_01812 [Enterococcus phoeniculicola ATCC BAA-412]